MAVNLYEPITNAVTGETFQLLSCTPEAYLMAYSMAPGGYVPFPHYHANQDERFEVMQGTLTLYLYDRDGDVRQILTVHAGDEITVKRGDVHQAFNRSETERVECRVSYSPGYDTFPVYQCFLGLILDNEMNQAGVPDFMKLGYMTYGACALTIPFSMPEQLFSLSAGAMYRVGSRMGWETQYMDYTGLPSREAGLCDLSAQDQTWCRAETEL